jgi:hypothetical protein
VKCRGAPAGTRRCHGDAGGGKDAPRNGEKVSDVEQAGQQLPRQLTVATKTTSFFHFFLFSSITPKFV